MSELRNMSGGEGKRLMFEHGPNNATLVDEFLCNRDQEREKQRKHEATHGWRNPPSVYEEDRSET